MPCFILVNQLGQIIHTKVIKSICRLLGVVALLGLTWGLAFFSFGQLTTPSLYLFCILNSLQGLHNLLKDEILAFNFAMDVCKVYERTVTRYSLYYFLSLFLCDAGLFIFLWFAMSLRKTKNPRAMATSEMATTSK